MAPARPKLVKDTGLEFKSFDQYVEEANAAAAYLLPISAEETITVECPTSNDLIVLADAQLRQDIVSMAHAVFKDDAARILELTGPKRFTVLANIVNDIMTHYGMAGQQLPES